MRLPIRILIYAGASAQTECYDVLHDALWCEDEELVKFMFEQGVDPNMKFVGQPMLSYAKTLSIARMFFQNGANNLSTVYQLKYDAPNLLWLVVRNDCYEAELLKVYLTFGIDPRALDYHNDNDCLLHCLAKHTYRAHFDDNVVIKTNILLTVIPDMINMVNAKGYTPLDCAELSLKEIREFCAEEIARHPQAKSVTLELIKLFTQAGGKRAVEL